VTSGFLAVVGKLSNSLKYLTLISQAFSTMDFSKGGRRRRRGGEVL